MGQRINFYKVPIKNYQKLKEYGNEAIYENDNDFEVERINIIEASGVEEMFDLMSENNQFKNEYIEDFNSNDDITYVFLAQEGLRILIEEINKNIAETMKYIMDIKNDETRLKKLENYVRMRLGFWINQYNIDLDLNNKDCVSNSWFKDYAIFDLVYLYKAFDFEKYKLIVTIG